MHSHVSPVDCMNTFLTVVVLCYLANVAEVNVSELTDNLAHAFTVGFVVHVKIVVNPENPSILGRVEFRRLLGHIRDSLDEMTCLS